MELLPLTGQEPPLFSPEVVTYYLIGVNFGTFLLFGVDKMLAENRMRRISEATLLMWAFLGGMPAAYAARALFRHKTRKEPFSSNLRLALYWQVGLAVLWLALFRFAPLAGTAQ